jgi:flagellar hook-associated protein 3 FlgL
MTPTSLGDLGQALQLRKDNLRLRSELQRLSTELATGQKSDPSASMSGDFGALGSIEATLARMTAYSVSAREAAMAASGTQAALELVQTNITEFAGPALLTLGGEVPALVDATARDARVRFDSVVSALNTRLADRALFAGSAVDGPALATSGAILDSLLLVTAGETTASGVETAVRAWFTTGGGFEVDGYLGAAEPAAAVPIAEGEMAEQPVTAADPAIRDTLAAFAMAALLDRGALAGQPAERATLARRAGQSLLDAEAKVVDLRGDLGAREAQIDRAIARLETGRTALELARSEILEVDPFETATRLQMAEAQLEALYLLTARLSRLTLTEFLR